MAGASALGWEGIISAWQESARRAPSTDRWRTWIVVATLPGRLRRTRRRSGQELDHVLRAQGAGQLEGLTVGHAGH